VAILRGREAVVSRGAEGRYFRGAKGNYSTAIDLPLAKWSLLVAIGWFAAVGSGAVRADDWRFNRANDVFDRHAALQARPVAPPEPRRVNSPVIRGQLGGGEGRSVPSMYPTPTRQPAQTQSGQPASTAYQSAPTSPAYGSDPEFGPPPLGADVNGGNLTGRGVLDELRPVGNDPYWEDPTRFIPLFPNLQESQTGRLMFGVGVNSDQGVMGSIILDEQNFDWTRFPRSFEEIRNATAWRGAGQHLRIEAVPGTEVQRYMINFQEPYMDVLGYESSLGLSGFYYTRQYTEWHENRVGGRVALGYHFTHALTGSLAFRGMKVGIFDLIDPAPQELLDAKGNSALYGFQLNLAHDTRDSSFLATEGHVIEASAEQVVGTWSYPRFEVDARKYFLMHERPDGSGRHVLSVNGHFAYTGDNTPIYENYFAGGFSTIRGFDFRGASPIDQATGVRVGGQVEVLASVEYLFPITADDMLRGVVFCDTGTVEKDFDQWDDKYRIAPGFGLRIVVPAMGPAPIALDFAFPVARNKFDEIETFSFFVGFTR
jgi:outer membrane protein insertion porin family